ncbi:MAG: flagellar biosynthesis protein FliQ [Pseudomonadota bacterium]
MNADQALYYLGQMLWAVLMVAGPLLVVTLIVGLLISIFQVTTQIQEITLSYVPKILSTGILLMLMGPWFLRQLTSFARSLYSVIPALGG